MQPMPCIACGKTLESAFDVPNDLVNQPYGATAFHTSGHYGSTVFDPVADVRLEINVCDECLTAHAAERVLYHANPNMRTGGKPWNPVTDQQRT